MYSVFRQPERIEMDVSVDDFLNLPIHDSSTAAADYPTSASTVAATAFRQSYTNDSIHFTDFLSIPTDDAAELEWLSRYMDDSITDFPATGSAAGAVNFQPSTVAGRARSKRSRPSEDSAVKKGEVFGAEVARRCTHCASEKTPQWRAGPLGPKTLCNACGVRYKSGRLVPEYRPAASPTFVLTQHSNSHRKVLELRRQKEQLRQQGVEDEGYGRHFGIC